MILGRIFFRPASRYGVAGVAASRFSLGRGRSVAATLGNHASRTIRRPESTVSTAGITGSDNTGHIEAGPNEAILFFDNLFPLKLSSVLFWRPWDTGELLKRFDNASLSFLDPISLVKRAIPETAAVKVVEFYPRLKEGGIYVKFTSPSGMSPAEVQAELARSLDKTPIKPWFSPFRGIKTGLVLGRPWLEDLYRLPQNRLKVEFVPAQDSEPPAELSQESLYSLFRRYGKIADISSQPPDSKVLPKYAYVDFVLLRDAIMARNCMHGFVLREEEGSKNPTRLRLSYEQREKPHQIWNWITNHPRIVIPIIAAFLAAFTVAVFDPIREFFVKTHVQKSFEFTDSRLYKWLKRQTSDILAFRRREDDDAGLSALFTHRKDVIDSIQNSLLESVDTFVVVHGPRGSGGRELVMDQVLQGRRNVLVLDCRQVVEARGEAGTIKKLANQVGYRPVFSWANNLSSMVDLAIQSTTGVKAGFSENLESQIVKILQTTATALKRVSLADRKKSDKDANLTDDAYLEAHPERRAVVVIDNFLHKGEEKGVLYDKIADWASALVQSNIAHVIFLTTDSSFSKPLAKALPDRVLHQITLGDLSPVVAKHFVVSQLEPEGEPRPDSEESRNAPVLTEKQRRKDLQELDECIEVLGGRLTDLQVLTRRLKVGQSPKKAVSDIIDQNASDILRMFLLGNKSGGGGGEGGTKWSAEQAWYLIRELASKETLRYNEVLLSSTFSSSTTAGAGSAEAAIESLASAELITVRSLHGRPATIRAGKPVYQAAFNRLLEDDAIRARMDLALLAELAKIEARTIEKAEAELAVLAGLPLQPYQAAERVDYLLAKLQGSQQKIVAYEKEMAGLKKMLSEAD
ncbi:4a3461aa-24aa-47d1-8714-2543c9c57da7 [Thermothielavioides terrestris]|uniref:Mitochondrial escape protein 2 n=1 Tax=Thermothielavioides terrestris TaxID=2587410 RepID=A0A3S4C3S4_9PEZI|nr:4a3461aa-24aa-47d1-8714-2543c9c57da7 [Thermothielavioides terrestris]